MIRIFPSRI